MLAERQLHLGQSVILDSVATFERIRAQWRRLAEEYGAEWCVIECVCTDLGLQRQRVESRQRGIPGWRELTWADVERVRGNYEPWQEERLVLDGKRPLSENIQSAINYLTAKNAKSAKDLALWANQILEMVVFGQQYEQDVYAQDRYHKLQTIGMEMLALADGVDMAALEPLRSTVLSSPTPFAVADCAVFDDNGRLALIKRADNNQWAMPGGALEIGETAAAGAAREFHEETGMVCAVTGLAGVFDSRLWGSNSRHHLYQFVFMGTLVAGQEMGNGSHKQEVLDVAWFAEADLPLAEMDVNHVGRVAVVFDVWKGEKRPFFDR
jgi:ADP-ribose pyrophosphatase YjhB (NUDIX family)